MPTAPHRHRRGYNGTITVAVRIADGQITGVTVVSTNDDGSY